MIGYLDFFIDCRGLLDLRGILRYSHEMDVPKADETETAAEGNEINWKTEKNGKKRRKTEKGEEKCVN